MQSGVVSGKNKLHDPNSVWREPRRSTRGTSRSGDTDDRRFLMIKAGFSTMKGEKPSV